MLYLEDIVEKILAHWQKNNLTSAIMVKDEFGHPQIDVNKAKTHLHSVELYNIVGNILPACEIGIREILKPKLASISKVVNDKHLKDYEAQISKQKQIQNQLNYLKERCNELILKLEIQLSLDDIFKDFLGERIFIKQHFGLLFSQYGINLDTEFLEAIFGKKQEVTKVGYRQKTVFKDNIEMASKGMRLNFPLSHQFASTQNGEAYGIFSAFFKRAAGQLMTGSNELNNDELKKSFYSNNPLYAETASVKVLANAIAPIMLDRMNNIEAYKKKKETR